MIYSTDQLRHWNQRALGGWHDIANDEKTCERYHMSDNAFQVITQKHSEKFEVKPE